MTALAVSAGDVLDYALAFFFVAIGIFFAWALLWLGRVFQRTASLIKGAERDALPVVVKAGTTVDLVNENLEKMTEVTDSAVSMADSADTAVRAVSTVLVTPVKKVSGLASGVSHAAASFRAHRDVKEAMKVAKDAAARRESELDEELRAAGGSSDTTGNGTPSG
jgi:hypothetical protein